MKEKKKKFVTQSVLKEITVYHLSFKWYPKLRAKN